MSASVDLSAQSKYMDQYMMPDPQTWGMIKYGGQTPDLYTGTVRAEIPVYTYKDPDFEIPISLSYASNGYLPNIQANFVGLGWTLNAGGCISRRVQGIQDESESYGQYDNHGGRYSIKGYKFYNPGALSSVSPIRRYMSFFSRPCFVGDDGCYETEPDIFMFNFLGHSGKFIMSESACVHVYGSNHPSGEYAVDLSGLNGSGFPDSGISITDGTGMRYDFGDLGVSTPAPYATYWEATGQESSERQVFDNYGSSWNLKRVTVPNGRTVEYYYSFRSNAIDPLGNKTLENFRPFVEYGSWLSNGLQTGFDEATHAMTVGTSLTSTDHSSAYYIKESIYQPVLDSIVIDTACKIEFIYSSRTREKVGPADSQSLSTPGKLSGIVVSDLRSGRVLCSCSLGYTYSSSEGNPVMMLKSVNVSGVGEYSMDYYHEDDVFPYHGSAAIDHWGYYNDNTSGISSLLPDLLLDNDTYVETVVGTSRTPNPEKSMFGMLRTISYPTGGTTTYEYEPHDYSKTVTRDMTDRSRLMPYLKILPNIAVAGGLRLKRVTDASGSTSTCRTYVYGDGVSSSGTMLSFPRYSEMITIASSSMYRSGCTISLDISSYILDATHIGYSLVREVYSDGSSVEHVFSDYESDPDIRGSVEETNLITIEEDYKVQMAQILYPDPSGLIFRHPQSMSTRRGRLLCRRYRSSDGTPLREETITYTGSPDDTTNVVQGVRSCYGYSYVYNTLLDNSQPSSVTVCDLDPVTGARTSKVTTYSYNDLLQKSSESLTGSDGVTRRKNRFYVQDIYPGARTSAESAMVARNVTSYPIYESESVTDAAGTWLVSARHNVYTQSGNMFLLSTVGEGQVAGRQQYANTIPASIPYRTVATYGSFNSQGRPCAVTDSNGIQSLLLWGYGGLYPVALVGNCTTSSFSSTGIDLTSDIDWNDLSNAQDAALRTIPGASVTTWKYLPFVGVSEKIGPDGRKTTYDYDDYGRLVSVKDTDDDKVEEYHYNIITE